MGGVLAALGGAIGVIALLVKTFQRYEQAWRMAAAATWRRRGRWTSSTSRRRSGSGPGERHLRDGVDLTVDCYTVSTGKSSTTYTRIVALAGILDPRAQGRGLGASIVKVFKGDDLEVGDPHFDARAVVRGSPRLLRALLDRSDLDLVLQALDLGIVVEDGKVKFNKAGLIRDADRLVHLAQVVTIPAQALRPGRPGRLLEHIAARSGCPRWPSRCSASAWPAGLPATSCRPPCRHPLPVIRLEAARASAGRRRGGGGGAARRSTCSTTSSVEALSSSAAGPDQGVRRRRPGCRARRRRSGWPPRWRCSPTRAAARTIDRVGTCCAATPGSACRPRAAWPTPTPTPAWSRR
ncbi:MAG: hypothetical protein R3F43_06770 [bacterium]